MALHVVIRMVAMQLFALPSLLGPQASKQVSSAMAHQFQHVPRTMFCLNVLPQGALSYYLAAGAAPVNDYKHEGGGIVRLFPQPKGVRTLFEDERGMLYLLNPCNDQVG
jgi:hypothetical protein